MLHSVPGSPDCTLRSIGLGVFLMCLLGPLLSYSNEQGQCCAAYQEAPIVQYAALALTFSHIPTKANAAVYRESLIAHHAVSEAEVYRQ